MTFSEAWGLLKAGKMIKLPAWGGYWVLENDTIMMHCIDGSVMDMFDSDDKLYTLSNIASNEWMEAFQINTPLLGGHITLTFEQAVKYLTQGKKMRRKAWVKGDYIELNGGGEFKYHASRMQLESESSFIVNVEDVTFEDWEFYNE